METRRLLAIDVGGTGRAEHAERRPQLEDRAQAQAGRRSPVDGVCALAVNLHAQEQRVETWRLTATPPVQ